MKYIITGILTVFTLWNILVTNNSHAQIPTTDSWSQFRHDAAHSGVVNTQAPNTNTLRWKFKTNGQVWSSPAVVGDTVFIGSDDSTVYALKASASKTTGEIFWSKRLSGKVRASPAAAYGFLYVTCYDGYLYCLKSNTGEIVWKFNIGKISTFTSSPCIVDEKVFVGSESGYLYCVKAITNNPNGELVWKYFIGKLMHGSPAVNYGRVFIGNSGDSTGGYHLFCLNESSPDTNGILLWKYFVGNLRWGIGNSPATVDSLIFFSIDDPYGQKDGTVFCLKVFPSLNDTLYWKYTGLGGMMSSPAVVNKRVFVGMEMNGKIDRSFLCFKEHPSNPPNAELIWRYTPIGGIRSSPAVADDKVFVGSESSTNALYCFNALSNSADTIWTYKTGGGIFSSPAVSNGMIFFGSMDGYVYGIGTPSSVGVDDRELHSDLTAEKIFLNQNYPNPFSQSTAIGYRLLASGHVQLEVYDLLGREVATLVDEEKNAGEHTSTFSAGRFADIRYSKLDIHPGIYFYRLTANNKTVSRTMHILK